jgi:diketogulonate reductase-like aldo/keto reductase
MAAVSMRTVQLPSGERIPALGQGTWRMGEHPAERVDELRALRLGLDLGLTLIDTAEMYADGAAEELVADAIEGRRDEVYLVSKVLPTNASRHGTMEACERSLKRLRTDRIDLYLLHWRGRFPLADTVEALTELKESGKIRHWGVSNFDALDLAELIAVTGGDEIQTDQVLYNLSRRQAEFELLPWCRDRRLPLMAYSPVDRGALVENDVVVEVAEKHGATPAQVALAWVLRHEDVCAIPKASIHEHVRENAGALELQLDSEDLKLLGEEFPPPHAPRRLDLY